MTSCYVATKTKNSHSLIQGKGQIKNQEISANFTAKELAFVLGHIVNIIKDEIWWFKRFKIIVAENKKELNHLGSAWSRWLKDTKHHKKSYFWSFSPFLLLPHHCHLSFLLYHDGICYFWHCTCAFLYCVCPSFYSHFF